MKKLLLVLLLTIASLTGFAGETTIKGCYPPEHKTYFIFKADTKTESVSLTQNFIDENGAEAQEVFTGEVLRVGRASDSDIQSAENYISELIPGVDLTKGLLFKIDEKKLINRVIEIMVMNDASGSNYMLVRDFRSGTIVIYAGLDSICQ